jgi:membrane protease YdiL (CAAX protease family)
MSDNLRNLRLFEYSPLLQILVSLIIILGIGFVLFVILLIPGFLLFGADISLITTPSSALGSNELAFLRYMVIVQDIAIFIVPAIIILYLMKPENNAPIPGLKTPYMKDVLLVIILAFFLFPITNFTGQLNSEMHLPDWMSGLEKWMIEKEDQADGLIDLLISSKTIWVMLLNIVMIAVLPAIGEELIFRGVFQRIFYKLFRSGHLAVWFTAFIFSAVHFQFLGFIPRFILGLSFGYLYLWSGTLWLPIIAHFVNNAVPVVGTYFNAFDNASFSDNLPRWEQLVKLSIPIFICLLILGYFRNKYKIDNEANVPYK